MVGEDDHGPEPRHARRIDRRALLRGAGAGVGLAALGAAAWGADDLLTSGPGRPTHQRTSRSTPETPGTPAPLAVSDQPLPSGPVVPVARWVVEENQRPGTLGWVLAKPTTLYGYADRVSAVAGDTVTVYVDAPSMAYRVELYRMGYYGGLGGRLVWESGELPAQPQPRPVLAPGTNMIECHWAPSLQVTVQPGWLQGMYLFKLVASDGTTDGYVPLCVRDPSSTAAFVVMSAVTTWQAYNTYGGYSLYTSPAGVPGRSRVVSYDRPYQHPDVANDFFGNEFPLVYMAERLGLDVTYITSVDLHRHPTFLLGTRCMFSLGHDEYWSATMRDAATSARDSGVNLAFLGANACYRHIRFAASPLGPDRHQICYKDRFMKQDPMWGVDPAEVTANWPSGPDPRPEQTLIGEQYSDIAADADMVVVDPGAWVFAGTGVTAGQHLPKAVQGEYDNYQSYTPGPRNVTILCHSPVLNRGPGRVSDMTYYTQPGGGGVLATGDAAFVDLLTDAPHIPGAVSPPRPGVTPVFQRLMENVFSVFGAGPASVSQPSTANWQQFY